MIVLDEKFLVEQRSFQQWDLQLGKQPFHVIRDSLIQENVIKNFGQQFNGVFIDLRQRPRRNMVLYTAQRRRALRNIDHVALNIELVDLLLQAGQITE